MQPGAIGTEHRHEMQMRQQDCYTLPPYASAVPQFIGSVPRKSIHTS